MLKINSKEKNRGMQGGNNQNNDSLDFSFDVQNDVILSMGQRINDLTLSLSQISTKHDELRKQLTQSCISSEQEIEKCLQGHPLRYQLVDESKNSHLIVCDHCEQGVDKLSNVFWHCAICDYDLCRACGGYKKNFCPFSHPLKFIEQYPHQHFQCDICYTKHLKSGWSCKCNFDVCEKCNSE